MRLVVDASAALEVCLAAQGFALLADHALVAPPLLPSEILSSLHALRWRREISRELALRALGRLPAMPVTFARPDDHERAAWDIAERLGWAKTYDAEYVALARALESPLLTVDGRLRRGASRFVEVLGPLDV